jgi:hypothetical protein
VRHNEEDEDLGQQRSQLGMASQEQKKVLIEIYCIEKCLLDLDPI